MTTQGLTPKHVKQPNTFKPSFIFNTDKAQINPGPSLATTRGLGRKGSWVGLSFTCRFQLYDMTFSSLYSTNSNKRAHVIYNEALLMFMCLGGGTQVTFSFSSIRIHTQKGGR